MENKKEITHKTENDGRLFRCRSSLTAYLHIQCINYNYNLILTHTSKRLKISAVFKYIASQSEHIVGVCEFFFVCEPLVNAVVIVLWTIFLCTVFFRAFDSHHMRTNVKCMDSSWSWDGIFFSFEENWFIYDAQSTFVASLFHIDPKIGSTLDRGQQFTISFSIYSFFYTFVCFWSTSPALVHFSVCVLISFEWGRICLHTWWLMVYLLLVVGTFKCAFKAVL